MKKIIFTCFLFLIAQNFVLADEIVDGRGTIIPCKIETVEGGLIQYHKEGGLFTFNREKDSLIFNDYVDVRTNLFKRDSIKRITGQIITKDFDGLRIKNEDGEMVIKNYRVKFIGIYKPENL